MAETRRYVAAANQLDLEHILSEAQHRWLRPPEICEILKNHQKFRISAEPQTMPSSGSLFLFDRKVQRYFRKDGHNWRKKKDGKTVKEAHEKLKAGNVDVLHCYYAHGEQNECFQRRTYWMLEEELSHMVLVHYREVQSNRTYSRTQRTVPCSQVTEDVLSSEVGSSTSCSFPRNDHPMHSQTTDTLSINGAQTSEYEDAESVYNQQAASRFHSYHDIHQPTMENAHAGNSDPHYPAPMSDDYQEILPLIPGTNFSASEANKSNGVNGAGLTDGIRKSIDSESWEDILGNCALSVEGLPFQASYTSTQANNFTGHNPKPEHGLLGQMFSNNSPTRHDYCSKQLDMEKLQHQKDQELDSDLSFGLTSRLFEQGDMGQKTVNNFNNINGKAFHSSSMKQHLLDGSLNEEALKKVDSFNRWMSKELGDVNELADANQSFMHSNSGAYWETVENENGVQDANSGRNLDGYVMSPSLSQDQLFSIIEFSPNWTYVGSEVKVLITGRFLKSQLEAVSYKWSCMFGEVEVPAEVIADGVLRCQTPMHEAGRVPFYITCSNRLACSEVREFEYRVGHVQDLDKAADNYSDNIIENLNTRFVKLLCSGSVWPKSDASTACDVSELSSKISSLLKENTDDWDKMLKVTSGQELSPEKMKDQLLEKLLKEKLHSWLLQKVAEGGKGPNVLDEGGQGVLHFAAALGYDWALEPTIVAGVSVNFRDVNGWTALHWAAFCGRERTIGSLIALGAAPGALTDPTPKFPSGSTPADLASATGHKGFAGYLAESALRTHFESLKLNGQSGDAAETSGVNVPQSTDVPYGSSLTDSLAAVCNATQAAASIHQVFRVQSFQRKQIKEFDDDNKFGMLGERALSQIAVKTHKSGHSDTSVHAAAIRIQNKFRSYKGRKEFLITRQRIIKIQALVRGHQVRKNYRKIIWSVGILEKVILRWRRKGAGLRGFKSEALSNRMQDTSTKEDNDDFFREGRKQTEERLQKALARVKSMVQYPEARDQYRRLLNVVNEIQESKVEKVLNSSEEMIYLDDDMIDLDALLGDDTLMPVSS